MSANPYGPESRAPASDDPTQGNVDTASRNLDADQGNMEASQTNCTDAYERAKQINHDNNLWNKAFDAHYGWLEKISEACSDYFAKVADLFKKISELDMGDPMAIFAAGEAYQRAQSTFSGQLTMMTDWNLPARLSWEGDAGDVYRAGVDAQSGAVSRLAQWCGAMGSELKQHARNVVAAYLAMQLDFTKKVAHLGELLIDLIPASISEIANIIKNGAKLVIELAVMVEDVATAFKLWANESSSAIDRIENSLADKSGTAAGQWPTFVRG